MALAQKGLLGDKLFYFDQKGPKSLLADWNHTFFMSKLLSDIHFMIGDLSMSEAYAMDGLTLAKRKGSPRMMQRLVQINLIKGDKNKYMRYWLENQKIINDLNWNKIEDEDEYF